MRLLHGILVVSGMTLEVVPGWAADLTKIDRTITKEPAYRTKNPKFCLLVFGPEAKTRAWLVLDGDVLYVDRNGDGDLTGAGERVEKHPSKGFRFEAGPIGSTGLSLLVRGNAASDPDIFVDSKLGNSFGQCARAGRIGQYFNDVLRKDWQWRLADRPADAPVVHFDGPLNFQLGNEKQVLVRGDKPCSLPIMVGTPGLGNGAFAALLFGPKDPHATAEIVFPNRNPDGKPIVVQVPLIPPN